jgi:hypothetical protein
MPDGRKGVSNPRANPKPSQTKLGMILESLELCISYGIAGTSRVDPEAWYINQ